MCRRQIGVDKQVNYMADKNRYSVLNYTRAGKSGLFFAPVSIGLYQNFGGVENYDESKKVLFYAFDNGITHFDFANNYGYPRGSAESNFGRLLTKNFKPYRDEIIISTKAGFDMWDGPYGNFGSRKYLTASLDQSLKRLGLDYVDIFYHHRPDYDTPLEETMLALDNAVRQGKALYVGLSNYAKAEAEKAVGILKQLGTPLVAYQPEYSMLTRWIEDDGVKDFMYGEGVGILSHSPLAMGLLTGKYQNGIPAGSRMTKPYAEMDESLRRQQTVDVVSKLAEIAEKRGQKLNQMAISWALHDRKICSVIMGVRTIEQLSENLKALDNLDFTKEELDEINRITAGYSLWQ